MFECRDEQMKQRRANWAHIGGQPTILWAHLALPLGHDPREALWSEIHSLDHSVLSLNGSQAKHKDPWAQTKEINMTTNSEPTTNTYDEWDQHQGARDGLGTP